MTAPTLPDRRLCLGGDPEDWTALGTHLTEVNLRALATCQLCPALDRCRAEYDALHPSLRRGVIAAGQVFNDAGEPTGVSAACIRRRCSHPRRPGRKTCSAACETTVVKDRAEARERMRRNAKVRAA